jgi:NADP-dependent 3-hydroxy acid dehydrogenase YdfG
MSKTIVICGYGPGISDAVAREFGRNGFQLALVARNGDRVTRAAAALNEGGLHARGFACDLSQPVAVKQLIADVRTALGPIDVLHWNAYARLAGDLSTCDVSELQTSLAVGVLGLTAAVQASLPDLRSQPDAAVLLTGGGFAREEQAINVAAVHMNAMGLAITKAAQHKLIGLLHAQLSSAGIFVGEVMVQGLVKSAAEDISGPGSLEPSAIAERFWELYQARDAITVMFP